MVELVKLVESVTPSSRWEKNRNHRDDGDTTFQKLPIVKFLKDNFRKVFRWRKNDTKIWTNISSR